MNIIFAAYNLASFFMLGLIWFVQILHYPLLKFVPQSSFAQYHHQHLRLSGYLIAPVMLVELITCILLFSKAPIFRSIDFRIQIFLVSLIWISTFFIQVPLHKKLSHERNLELIDRLVKSNWVRTIFWTIKAFLLLLPSLHLLKTI